MSTPKRSRVPHRRILNRVMRLPKHFMAWLLRLIFIGARFTRARQSGFVLPTTVLLLLVVSLTVGSLSFRAFSRSANVIAEREQQVVYGAATPAVDRAKAKLEYLFDKKVPSNSTPKSDDLEEFLKDDSLFSLPDETRININGDAGPDNLDNAWWFPADVNGDGTIDGDERIVYSILVGHEGAAPSTLTLESKVSQAKADELIVRNGPVDVSSSGRSCPVSLGTNEEGWQEITAGGTTIKKNFQIDAFTVSAAGTTNRTASALEVQQVRQSQKGNKWGAWFKYDLEIFPGSSTRDFTWNGAMHTEGSLVLGPTNSDMNLRMLSSYNSCLYSDTASDIELVQNRAPNNYNGQVIAGTMTGETPGFGGNKTKIDSYATDGAGNPDVAGPDTIDVGVDSIATQPANIDDLALDPIKLFTADELDYRDPTGWAPDLNFWTRPFATNRIARTEQEDTPFLDDTYRADGRFGPKSVYDSGKGLSLTKARAKLGDLIASVTTTADFTAAQRDEVDSIAAPFTGLDGYWEKQATDKGAKIVVGERLQLGNPFGWKGAAATAPGLAPGEMEALYPPYDNGSSDTINGLDDQSLRLHVRSLHDNLAAVQSMAVYHYKAPSKTYPLACMAMVSHPGTEATVKNARTLNQLPKNNAGALSLTTGNDLVNVDFDGTAGNDVKIDTDFFFGYGTNAWEYEPPLGNETDFATAYDNAANPLKKALTNLAFFAGDPEGGSPSFTPVQGQQGTTDPFIHPYPYLSMWGDYSNLRRILEPTASGGLGNPNYANLSVADKTTVHTAACTLGMLATNIQVADSLDYTDADVTAALDQLAAKIGALILSTTDYTPDEYISALAREYGDNSTGTEEDGAALSLARLLHLKVQIERDRTYGFLQTPAAPALNYTLLGGAQTIATGQAIGAGATVTLGFDPTVDNYFGAGAPTTAAAELRFLRLAAIAGGLDGPGITNGLPKFPALYYLFPIADHDYKGSGTTAVQPLDEPYIDPNLDGDPTNDYTDTSNGTTLYTYQSFPTAADLDPIRAEPRGLITDWTLPYTTTDLTDRPNLINYNSGTDNAAILFQDKSFLDGREMLSVRTVEIDVDMATEATNAAVPNRQVGGQSWFTEGEAATGTTSAVQGGIFYAFREDARREDELFRPIDAAPLTKWGNCDTTAEVLSAACQMNFDVGAEQDPPIRRLAAAEEDNYISTKPVDFYPDPERRPYGFRLSNGESLNRADDVATGLTFITDNALYVKGDFNLHRARKADPLAPGVVVGDPLEEFLTPVAGAAGPDEITRAEFYDDRGAAVADFDTVLFAKSDGDDWRAVELVADATNILSDNFNDGVIRDYFYEARGGTAGSATSSYQNAFRINNPGTGVFNPITSVFQSDYAATGAGDGDPIWPFWIRRNGDVAGNAIVSIPGATTIGDDRAKDRIPAVDTTVNALLIGGIIPSRESQSYGGLHNFPRLNQHWPGHDLKIAGAFYQLNFSTASTGLFEQDIARTPDRGAWEPGVAPLPNAGGRGTQYFYGAPGRKWGYDVAFQYTSPGPVSQRFTGNESIRSEYYKELPADDPYVKNLQCATDAGGAAVVANPTVTCP